LQFLLAQSAILLDFVDRADIGMVQSGRGLRLAQKAFESLLVSGDIAREKFQRDDAVVRKGLANKRFRRKNWRTP
jgi:hypothetical protein